VNKRSAENIDTPVMIVEDKENRKQGKIQTTEKLDKSPRSRV
jgi:hypothetical protein